jgi:hypothetical protein
MEDGVPDGRKRADLRLVREFEADRMAETIGALAYERLLSKFSSRPGRGRRAAGPRLAHAFLERQQGA